MTVERIGRYIIRGELGRGAMGVVFRAEDPTIGRTVALKTTRLDLGGDRIDRLERLRREAHAAGMLNHANIVTIHDAGEDGDLFYIAMEAMEGQTLQDRLAQSQSLAADEVTEIGAQICAGLDYAHSHGVVHRDVKPSNIMLTAAGMVKIMDFGIAKGAGAGITSTGQVLGTPSYMSPEQVMGYPLDGRSDLFSVGVMLYEMATGQRPFKGESVTSIIYKIVNEHPVPPRDLAPQLDPRLSTVILKALAKMADDRFQSAGELVEQLRGIQLGPGTVQTAMGQTRLVSSRSLAAAKPVEVPTPRSESGTTEPWHSAPRSDEAPPQSLAQRNPAMLRVAVLTIIAMLASGSWLLVRSQRRAPEEIAQAGTVPAAASALSATVTPGTSAKPVAGAGDLELVTIPEGAEVTIGGRALAEKTPLSRRLPAGTHRLVFRKEGYGEEKRMASVAAGKKGQLSVYLKPVKAQLVLTSTPPGADIILDGKASGRQTPAELFVERGQHEVSLRKEGFDAAHTTTPKLQAGESYHFAPVLSKPRNPRGGT